MFPKIYYKNSLIEIYYNIRQVHPPTFGLLIKDYSCKISSFHPTTEYPRHYFELLRCHEDLCTFTIGSASQVPIDT